MVDASALRGAKSILDQEVAAGHLARGAQMCVAWRGEVFEYVAGDAGIGRNVELETIFKVYCAIKPVTAIAIAKLVERGALDLDAPLHEWFPSFPVLKDGTTARHILTHTAGLELPSGFLMEMLRPDDRSRFLENVTLPPESRLGVTVAYSEYFGWYLLGRLIESVTGEPLRCHLRNSVLEPLGMHDTWIGMTKEEHQANYDRLGLNYDLRQPKPYLILTELSERVCCEVNCAYGGYTNARDLARFYAALLEQLHGARHEALPSEQTLSTFCSPAREEAYDMVLKRTCNYGLGFMVGLSQHHFGASCSPNSFGHSGWLGGSFAFADPAAELAVAIVLNGIIDSDSSFLRRTMLVQAIYSDLGLAEHG